MDEEADGKHQIPSSKLQRSPKFQIPITVPPALAVARPGWIGIVEISRCSRIQHPTSDAHHRTSPTSRTSRVSSRMVADDVRRRILVFKVLPPRYLGGYGFCNDF